MGLKVKHKDIRECLSIKNERIDPITAITAKECFTNNCYIDVRNRYTYTHNNNDSCVRGIGLGKGGEGLE